METTDVMVIGGGGCGLALAIFLADQNTDFILIERRETTSHLPKAHYLNQRTMEILRHHGVADDVQTAGTPAYNRSRTKWYTSFGGESPLDQQCIFETGGLGGHGSPFEARYREASAADSANLPQLRLEPILRRHAEQRSGDRVRFGHELLSYEQDRDGVTCFIRDLAIGRDYQVRSRYIVGADRGRTVGPAAGIELEGVSDLVTQVSVHFKADLSPHYPDDRVLLNWLRSPYRPGVSVIVPMGPGEWGRHSPEWSIGFPRLPGDPEWTENNVAPVIRAILGLPDLAIEVLCKTEWAVEGVVASAYRAGRALIAGDAAHRHPPTTGLGLNTGIQDAHNLAWKLALVTRHGADDSLLETYEAERRPVGAFNVEWALNAFFNHFLLEAAVTGAHPGHLAQINSPEHIVAAYTALLADGPNGRMRRARLAAIYGTQRIEFYAQDVELGFVYPQGAFVPDGTPPPARDPMGTDFTPVARPGHRVPHVWLDDHGTKVSTHDLVSHDLPLVLLTGPQCRLNQDALDQCGGGISAMVRLAKIGQHVRDNENRLLDVLGIGPAGALLIRPDNIVAWRSRTEAEPAGLVAALNALGLCLAT